MKVVVDMEMCIGSGMCTTIAPTVFDLDDAGELILLKDEVADDTDEARLVRDAVACCPVEAIVEPR